DAATQSSFGDGSSELTGGRIRGFRRHSFHRLEQRVARPERGRQQSESVWELGFESLLFPVTSPVDEPEDQHDDQSEDDQTTGGPIENETDDSEHEGDTDVSDDLIDSRQRDVGFFEGRVDPRCEPAFLDLLFGSLREAEQERLPIEQTRSLLLLLTTPTVGMEALGERSPAF